MRLGLEAGREQVGLRTLVSAFGPPAAVTLAAALPVDVTSATAALGYVLAVVASAVVGGLWAGVLASVVSFLALNFFFTPPFHTFTVAHTEDLVALGVFLAVSATVGTMLSRVLTQRARAERREREARLLHHLGTRLLTGVATDEVLRSLATSLTDLFELTRCEIAIELAQDAIVVDRDGHDAVAGPSESIPIVAGEREIGAIVATLDGGRSRLSSDERSVIQTIASQVALAIERMRLVSEAQEARVEAETNRLRAALFSSVTHDLRTPLASITASVTSLREAGTPLTDIDRRELLETIQVEAERLNRLVGNFLDLSRMRAGVLTPAKAPAAIDEVIEGTVGRLAPILRDHEVRLVLRERLPEIPLDVVQIDQALTNVLENAARVTPPGKRITVSAASWQSGVQVRIADQGPGVPPDQRERVFEPFVRAEGSPGAGLGLAIARAIVEAHGGTVRITDAPGGGAAVVIELPKGT